MIERTSQEGFKNFFEPLNEAELEMSNQLLRDIQDNRERALAEAGRRTEGTYQDDPAWIERSQWGTRRSSIGEQREHEEDKILSAALVQVSKYIERDIEGFLNNHADYDPAAGDEASLVLWQSFWDTEVLKIQEAAKNDNRPDVLAALSEPLEMVLLETRNLIYKLRRRG